MVFTVTAEDLKRWGGQKRKLLEVLSDGRMHEHTTLVRSSGNAQNLTARISELRKSGWVITCDRPTHSETTYYQLAGFTGEDNTQKTQHCSTCQCLKKSNQPNLFWD